MWHSEHIPLKKMSRWDSPPFEWKIPLKNVQLVIGPVCSCTISTPWRAYSTAAMLVTCRTTIAISVPSGTHLHLSEVKHLTQHWYHNVPVLRGEKHDISRKFLHLASLELAQQAATLARLHSLAIAPHPSLSTLTFWLGLIEYLTHRHPLTQGAQWYCELTASTTGGWPAHSSPSLGQSSPWSCTLSPAQDMQDQWSRTQYTHGDSVESVTVGWTVNFESCFDLMN